MSSLSTIYPIRLEASLHETLWGGRKLERENWKHFPSDAQAIGEAWETEISTLIQNGIYTGKTLGAVVNELGSQLLGSQAIAIFGHRFPLLAKFIDANAELSVQVHPKDEYAARHEHGKLGKTEFWYILSTEPDAKIVYGFQQHTNRDEVEQAIRNNTLEHLLHEERVYPGDVVFVPAGTVHAICRGVLLYELQEYSDITYRLYDYGRLTASGKPRELHIERSLDVTDYRATRQAKVHPVSLAGGSTYEERCLVACRYFVTRELQLQENGVVHGTTEKSCVILSSLGANIQVFYGSHYEHAESLSRGETMVLPAALSNYRIEGQGVLLSSYVPLPDDRAWRVWREHNFVGT